MEENFYAALGRLFDLKDFSSFYRGFLDFYDNFNSKGYELSSKDKASDDLLPICKPLEVLHPTRIRRPNHAKTPLALAKIIHSVAHIEYSAIVLALDTSYRFRGLPYAYYADWLEVAYEEIKHFMLLQEILAELGYAYGDFPVHFSLFDAMLLTREDLALRMGIVHRGLEARGLDANPFVLAKVTDTPLAIKSKIKEVFKIILSDEINHVSKGDKWWQYAQTQANQAPFSFLDLCRRYPQFSLAGKILNVEARLKAGFSQKEIEGLQNFYELKHR